VGIYRRFSFPTLGPGLKAASEWMLRSFFDAQGSINSDLSRLLMDDLK